jgi:glycosyltransferase involved in cell wall biosynthesis
VVSVYNGDRYLLGSLQSVLDQQEVDLELVVVNDGSTDRSPQVLTELAARDPRVRVLHQENQGLTRALIRGCAAARGEFIARHDADDLSYSGRFARQLRLLQSDPQLSMVSVRGRALGPEDEELFTITRPADKEEATRLLLGGRLGPPAHGSVMFRAEQYRRVGGYRVVFNYAEDWDLWLRLVEVGHLAYVPEVLYAFRVQEYSISALRREQQFLLLDCALRCYRARAQHLSEEPGLQEAARLTALPLPSRRVQRLGNTYFIGKCLLDRRDARALGYLKRSVRQSPWHVRGWVALLAACLLCKPLGVSPIVKTEAPMA